MNQISGEEYINLIEELTSDSEVQGKTLEFINFIQSKKDKFKSLFEFGYASDKCKAISLSGCCLHYIREKTEAEEKANGEWEWVEESYNPHAMESIPAHWEMKRR